MVRMGGAVRFEESVVVNASPEAMWPLAADTERVNRATGLPRVHYAATNRAGGGSTTVAEYRAGRVPIARWTEDPFEWQAPLFYHVQRRYHWGPIALFRGGMQLTPTDDGQTSVRVWADLEPRGPLGWLAVQAIGRLGIRRGVEQVERFGNYLRGESDSPFPTLLHATTDEAPDAPWTRINAEHVGPELVDRLRRHVTRNPDPDIVDMRPFALADAWQSDRNDVLRLFLEATAAGVLVMHWDVLCPHCRAAKARYASMAQIAPRAFCASCAVSYQADFERNVELRFDVAPSVRRVVQASYCQAGPMNTPHRVARQTVSAHGITSLEADFEDGRYRLVSRQSEGSVNVEVGFERSSGLSTRIIAVDAEHMRPAALQLTAGAAHLSIANHLDVALTLDLERSEWPDTLATPAHVSTLNTFRDLFSTDVLGAGQQVAVGRLTFVGFGVDDASGLYASLGQGRAFRVIESAMHTALKVAAAHRGVVSGALGETVLVTFTSPSAGLTAARAVQRAMAGTSSAGGVDMSRVLRSAVHDGPCLAASIGNRVEYFGTTPRLALSMLEGARGGEIVVSPEVAALAGANGQAPGWTRVAYASGSGRGSGSGTVEPAA